MTIGVGNIDMDLNKLSEVELLEYVSAKIGSRGEWQKTFVKKCKEFGLSEYDARTAMGITCEYRNNAFIDGHNHGMNIGYEEGLKKGAVKALTLTQVDQIVDTLKEMGIGDPISFKRGYNAGFLSRSHTSQE